MVLHIDDDFDPDKIADSGQCFRWAKTDENTYRIPHGDACLYITAKGDGSYDLSCTEEEFAAVWRDYFDLSEDYSRIRALIQQEEDPFLYAAAEQEKGIRILRQDPWEMLISFIISQNKNIPAIRKSIELLCECCGEVRTDVREKPFYAFPNPEAVAALSEEDLRSCRLGYRCKYVHEAAEAVRDKKIDLQALMEADCDSAVDVLTDLYGVGVKVASCVALFGLHQLDAFPKDVWIRRILEDQYPAGCPFGRYSPYNGVFQQYMFAHYRKNYHKYEQSGN